jgi:predicted alpha/beta superfamily hydrolase
MSPSESATAERRQTIDLHSRANGRDYRLTVWQPPVAVPPQGLPVLWLLDGPGYNGLAVDSIRNRGVIGSEIEAAIVVAIGYPDQSIPIWMARRFSDFTPTAAAVGDIGADQPECGGLEGFLDTLQHDAFDAVAREFPIDPTRGALVGHSLGGLAVIHALFTRPTMFESFLAISPSIWWNRRVVLTHEQAFAAQVQSRSVAPRVFIGVGSREQTPPARVPPGFGGTLEDIKLNVARSRMVDEARELAMRLQSLAGAPAFTVRWSLGADESHLTIPFMAFRPALDLAFARATD